MLVWPKKQSYLLQTGAMSPKPSNGHFAGTLKINFDPLSVFSVTAAHMNNMLSTEAPS